MLSLLNLFKRPAIQQVLKAATVYTGANFVNRLVPFLLLPVLTRFLSPEDYGLLATFVAILGIVQIVIYMGATDAVVRNYLDRDKQNFDFSKYGFNAILIMLCAFAAITAGWWMLRNQLTRIIPIPFNYQLLIPLLGLLISISGIPAKLLVIMKKPLLHAAFNTFGMLVEFALAVILVVAIGLSWKGRVISIVVAKSLLCATGIGILLRYGFLKFSLNTKYLMDILRFGFPMVGHSLSFVLIAAIDRFFLNKFISLSATGLYSVTYSLCSIIAFLATAFNLALLPFIYERLGRASEAVKSKLVKFTYLYFTLILLGVALFIWLVPHTLNVFLGKRFLGAGVFIFWLALGFGFYSMYIMIDRFIIYHKKTSILSFIGLITVVLSVVLNYVLIKLNGAIGVAQATCLVFLSRFLLTWYFSNKVYPLPWLAAFGAGLKY